MKKKIWIFNHYATNMFRDRAGRHFWFSKNLLEDGHSPTIFCASTIHNSREVVNTAGEKALIKSINNIPFVFVNTPNYSGNGIQRVKNMIAYYKNLFTVTKEYANKNGKPDVIFASSVHPLTLVAGIKIARLFNVKCLCEVRDLWPETLVEYGSLKKNSFLAKCLYSGEKWIYQKADELIFTMEGGKDYINSRGWGQQDGGPIDIRKVNYINNGIDLEEFNFNKKHFTFKDHDIESNGTFKVIYAGSIRKANNVRKIIEAAQLTKKKGYKNIVFLIFGEGDEKKALEKFCLDNNLDNVKFKGFVEKKMVPYILSRSNLNIMHFEQNNLKRYGASLNKIFEYFASGKPTISDCEFGYDLIKNYKSGKVIDNANADQLSEGIISFYKMNEIEYEEYCKNAKKAAKDFDYKVLTDKLKILL